MKSVNADTNKMIFPLDSLIFIFLSLFCFPVLFLPFLEVLETIAMSLDELGDHVVLESATDAGLIVLGSLLGAVHDGVACDLALERLVEPLPRGPSVVAPLLHVVRGEGVRPRPSVADGAPRIVAVALVAAVVVAGARVVAGRTPG